MGSKICCTCKNEISLDLFNKNKSSKDGYSARCKECRKKIDKLYREKYKEKAQEYKKQYRLINNLKIKEYDKKYYLNNKESFKVNGKKYREENCDKIREYSKNWRINNRKNIREYMAKRREDYIFKLKDNLRSLIIESFKNKGYDKKSNTFTILGCSFEEFKIHLESQFEEWMNWGNRGNPKDGILEPNKTWDIDHIIPLSSAKTEEDIIKLNHYTNLQPLCSYVNRFIKKDNYDSL